MNAGPFTPEHAVMRGVDVEFADMEAEAKAVASAQTGSPTPQRV